MAMDMEHTTLLLDICKVMKQMLKNSKICLIDKLSLIINNFVVIFSSKSILL